VEKKVSKLIYNETGNPSEVLQFVETDLPIDLEEGNALIEVFYSNINPSDMGMIGGSYGRLKELPAIAGREGVGRIHKLSDATEGFERDHARPSWHFSSRLQGLVAYGVSFPS